MASKSFRHFDYNFSIASYWKMKFTMFWRGRSLCFGEKVSDYLTEKHAGLLHHS